MTNCSRSPPARRLATSMLPRLADMGERAEKRRAALGDQSHAVLRGSELAKAACDTILMRVSLRRRSLIGVLVELRAYADGAV